MMPYPLSAVRSKPLTRPAGPGYASGEIGSVDGFTAVIRFDEPMKSAHFATGVTIKVNTVDATIDSATLQTDKHYVYYVLHVATVMSDVVTWEYAKATGDIANLSDVVLEDVSAKTLVNHSVIIPYTPAFQFNDARNSMYL
jgi:hypothetical protein